jgi:hypothetical protein
VWNPPTVQGADMLDYLFSCSPELLPELVDKVLHGDSWHRVRGPGLPKRQSLGKGMGTRGTGCVKGASGKGGAIPPG